MLKSAFQKAKLGLEEELGLVGHQDAEHLLRTPMSTVVNSDFPARVYLPAFVLPGEISAPTMSACCAGAALLSMARPKVALASVYRSRVDLVCLVEIGAAACPRQFGIARLLVRD